MIDKDDMGKILQFVGTRWIEIAKDMNSEVMQSLPSNFWMNSVGGSAGRGRWVTALMYTESPSDADAFKEVLLRWQSKGVKRDESLDVLKMGKKG